MKACIAVLMLMIFAQGALGSAPCIATELERTFGGSEDDEGQSVLMTGDGGYIIAGSTKSDSAGGYDAWLLNADIEGNKIWSKTFGGLRDDKAHSVQQTSDDGYIITGATRSTGAGGYDIWAIKTDRDGNRIWDKTFGGRLDDEGNSIRRTADGGYIIAGKTRSMSSDGNYDASLIKIDEFGNEIWDRTFAGPLDDEADLALPTSDGGYIVVGATSSYGAGGYDAWLIKTDGEGNRVWDRTFGGVESELNPWSKGWSAEQTDDGGYILAGSTKSYGSGGYDIWAVKTDEMGNKIWDKTFGGPLDDEGDSVLKTSGGEYILFGSTSSYGAGGYDAWMIKMGQDGAKVWDKTYGGKLDDKAYSAQLIDDGSYLISGITGSYGAYSPEKGCCNVKQSRTGENEAWLIKIRSGSPGIAAQPESLTVCEDQAATFSVEAMSSETLVYQWRRNGVEIRGANANVYAIPSASVADAGNYSVMVSNSCGLIESIPAMLTVNTKPLIQAQPSGQAVCSNSPAAFRVVAAGTEPLSYQWMKNGQIIAGERESVYSKSSVSFGDAGSYSVVVSNICGSAESSIAVLTVNSAPSIQVQPASQEICIGSEAAFSAEVTGSEPISYQWMRNGVEINGANSDRYVISKARSEDAGNYSLMARNDCGSMESNRATLTVNSIPSIRVQPSSQLVCEGSSVTLSVAAAGTPPLSYQWMVNGEGIAGANSDVYTIPNVSRTAGCNCYSVMISNLCGSVESEIATLTLNSVPSIQVQPASQEVCIGSAVTFNAAANGTEPISYQWMKNGRGITGAIENIYSIPSVSTEDEGSYSVMVSNPCGSVESSAATLTLNQVPTIQAHPTSQEVCIGSAVTFNAAANGTEPISYQWMKNGEGIVGATGNIYSIPSVSTEDEGSYSVMVGNICGSIESDIATLTLNSAPSIQAQPASQVVCIGSAVTFNAAANGTEPISYQWMKNGEGILGATGNSYSIPSVSVEDEGTYSVMVSNPCGSVESIAATLTLDQVPTIQAQPTSQEVCIGSSATFNAAASGTEPISYQWMKNGEGILGATGNIYSIPSVSVEDEGSYSVMVSNPCGSVESGAATLTLNQAPSLQIQPASQVVCIGSVVTFNAAANGTEPLSYQWMKGGEGILGATGNSYSIPSVSTEDEGSYSVMVSNPCGSIESSAAALTVISGPTIVAQPLCQDVCSGSSAAFSVEATGAEPLYYQWRKDGADIPGANQNSYQVPCTSESDEGCYQVVVQNRCGWIESDVAALSVSKSPCITVQPVSQIVCECACKAVVFSVTATGAKPLYYQWKKDGVILPGANLNKLRIFEANADDASGYTVVVSNSYGSIESNAAFLQVSQPPQIARGRPICQEITVGESFALRVDAMGTGPLSYQWMRNGLNISGATSSTYFVENATKDDTGNYRVLVSSGNCPVESNIGTVKVAEGALRSCRY